MIRKLLGVVSGMFSLGSLMFTVMAIGDLIGGGSNTRDSVLMGLVVFFGGLTATTGYSAVRLLRAPAQADDPTDTTKQKQQQQQTDGIDIALEARILAHAAKTAGRVTSTEIAIACQVSIDEAIAALDQLCSRGHADLAVADDGSSLYVIKGFLSEQQKQAAEEIVV